MQKKISCYVTQQLILGTGTAIWWVTEPHWVNFKGANKKLLWTEDQMADILIKSFLISLIQMKPRKEYCLIVVLGKWKGMQTWKLENFKGSAFGANQSPRWKKPEWQISLCKIY